jgi:hypothetical protein
MNMKQRVISKRSNLLLARMCRKLLLATCVSFLFISSASSQKFLRIAEESQSKNFEEIVEEAEHYYDSLEALKKDRIKDEEDDEDEDELEHFYRWKYFNESRLTADGKIVNVSKKVMEEYVKYLLANKKSGKLAAAVAGSNTTGNWSSLGPTSRQMIGSGYSSGIGRVNCIVVDPSNSTIIYAGSPSGGLWRSTTGGNSWTCLTDGINATIGVSGIAIDPASPTNNRTIYILTGDGDGGSTQSLGVFKSVDNGNNWVATGLSWGVTEYRHGYKLLINPNNHLNLFAMTSDGIYKTTDGGNNWTLVNYSTTQDAEFHPTNSNIIYASATNYLYKSIDGGSSWFQIGTNISSSGRMAIAVTPANPSYVYVLQGDNGAIFRSQDEGQTFTQRGMAPEAYNQIWYDIALAASPVNPEIINMGELNTFVSNDGGVNWTTTSQWVETSSPAPHYTHADIHAMEYFGSTLYCGSDGGIFKSIDNAANWTDISAGLSITQLYRIGCDPNNANRIICGAQDNGMNILSSKVLNQWYGADGFEGIVDPVDPNVIYGSFQNGGLLKSTDGGTYVQYISPGGAGSGNWLTPYILDPSNHNTVYAGFADLWKSNDQGNSWVNLSNGVTSGAYIGHIAVAPSNSNYIYFSTYSTFYRSTDGGASWTYFNNLGWETIKYFVVNPTNPSEVYLVKGDFSEGQKVFKSTDAGSSWVNISGSLPNIPVNCIVYQKGSNSGLYIGTDNSVFYKDDSMSDWTLFSTGLPHTIVNELEIYYATNKLRAGTYGRGVWESDLFSNTNTSSNLALNKPVTASSVESNTTPATYAVDGNASTRWSTLFSDPQWIYVDLQNTYAVNRVKITWEAAYGKDYKVQISNDANTWTDLKSVVGNTSLVNDWTGLAGTGRFVRVYGTARATAYGYSIYELEVYGSSSQNSSPVVTISSPANNSVYNAPASIVITASASDSDGSISKVEFYQGTTYLGVATTAPYTFTWNNVGSGTYAITAKAYDNLNASTTSSPVTVIVNVPPTVSITSPANNSTFTEPATISISANASDSDGSITKVEFYQAGNLLGFTNSAPFNYNWSSVAAGSYVITAKAYDNNGGVTTSAPVNVTVTGSSNPNLALNKPVTSSSNETGATLASYAVDGNYSTRWSSLFSDPQWIYVDLQNTYSINRVKITWEAAYGKDYKIQTSNDAVNWTDIQSVTANTQLTNDWIGLSGSGRYVRVYGLTRGTPYGYSIYELEVYGGSSKTAPTVTITGPLDNTRYSEYSTVVITANASTTNGSISKVEFYQGSTLLGTSTTSPFSYTWSNVAAGTYTLTAKAYDNSSSTVSSPVKLFVDPVGNLALQKMAVASSTETAQTPAPFAVDGNAGTRWSSLFSDPQWIYVDLEKSYNINRVKITWEAAYGKDYKIQVSNDANTWTDIKTVTGNTSLVNDWNGLTGTGRYVRMYGTARGTAYGYSIYEFEVYGTIPGKFASDEAVVQATADDIKVYPNPADQLLNIAIENMENQEVNYVLVNNKGEQVLTNTVHLTEGNSVTTLDVSQLPAGLYLLTIRTKDRVVVKSISVLK